MPTAQSGGLTMVRMALVSLLLATALMGQAPVKLAHTYVKDQKTVYAMELKFPEGMGQITADIIFVTLDTDGNHSISVPKLTMAAGGEETTKTYESAKTKFDDKGLTEELEFDETGVAVILPSVMSYLPAASIEKDKEFEVKEKREKYTLEGKGKLIELAEKDGKQLVTIEYKLTLQPSGKDEPGVLTFTSIFEVATGQLVSSKGTAEIGQTPSTPISVVRK